MKLRCAIASALLLWGLSGAAALKFDQTVIEDVVMPGDKSYPFEFSFKNTGDSIVEISEVKTSCGCTTVKLEKMVYAPGESGAITGNFSVGDRQGLQQKSISVLTKGLGQPDIRLSLKLEIPQLATMRPGLLLWRVGGELVAKTLKISPNVDMGVEIVSVESDSESFILELKKKSVGRGCIRSVGLAGSARCQFAWVNQGSIGGQGGGLCFEDCLRTCNYSLNLICLSSNVIFLFIYPADTCTDLCAGQC
jgi:hypothetical protein